MNDGTGLSESEPKRTTILGSGDTPGYMIHFFISFILGLQSMLNSAEAMREHLTSLCFRE